MKLSRVAVLAGLAWGSLLGQVTGSPNVSISIGDEVVPAGGVVQVKVKLTEPKPIIRTGMRADMDASFFDEYLGISAAAGLHGIAMVTGGKLRLELATLTPEAYNPDYPILMVAVRVKAGLPVGYRVPVALDLANSSWLNPLGVPYPKEAKAGTVTIGGTQYISNVLPGGGLLQPGQTFRVLGGGFDGTTKSRSESARLRSVRPNELLFEVKQPMRLDGAYVVVTNKANERTEYYSYLRGLKGQPTRNAALQGVVPVFSSQGNLLAVAALSGNRNAVVGIGLQNPTAAPVTIELECEDALWRGMAGASVTLGAGEVVMRSYEELFGGAVPVGALALKAKAKTPFQMAVAEIEPATGAVKVPTVVPVVGANY